MSDNESVRKAHEDMALMDYNEAYYRWVFCPESEKDRVKDILDKYRHIWFNL